MPCFRKGRDESELCRFSFFESENLKLKISLCILSLKIYSCDKKFNLKSKIQLLRLKNKAKIRIRIFASIFCSIF